MPAPAVSYTENNHITTDSRRWPALFGIEDALIDIARDLYDAIGWPGVVFLMAMAGIVLLVPLILLSVLVRLFTPWHDAAKAA